MATDNAVMRYKDIKYYNEKLQDSMPSGGGVSSLADLGITLSADEINNLPTDIASAKNAAIKSASDYVDKRLLYSDTSVTFSSLNDTNTKTINTYINSYSCKIIGSSVSIGRSSFGDGAPVVVSYYPYDGYFYAYLRLYTSTYGGSEFTATLRTLYMKV